MTTITQQLNDILYIYNISGSMVDYSHIPENHRIALLYPEMMIPLNMNDSEEVQKEKRRAYLKEHFKPSQEAIEKADFLLNEKINALNEM